MFKQFPNNLNEKLTIKMNGGTLRKIGALTQLQIVGFPMPGIRSLHQSKTAVQSDMPRWGPGRHRGLHL